MRRSTESDQKLVEQAKSGSREAFDHLVIRHRNRLIRQLNPIIRSSTDAEDVVQETFIKAYKSLRHFRGDSAFFTWIYRIAINTANSNFAQTDRTSALSDLSQQSAATLELQIAVDAETPESKLEDKQFLNLLDAILQSLPEEQRTAFMLREVEGLSYDEIAEKMHSPVGTVRSRIHRVREAVISALGGQTGFPVASTRKAN